MTQTVSAREVQAAGGLDKWAAKTAQGRASAPVLQAKGRKPADPYVGYDSERMNGLEARYAGRLEAMRRAGKIIFWRFEAMALRLANRTVYNPDFLIMLPDGSLGFHETKGVWRDDARAKIKIAAEQFPWFFFEAVQWDKDINDWKFERFRARGK